MVRRLQVGDTVTVQNALYERAGSWSDVQSIRVGETQQVTITRVMAERVIVRGTILGGERASVYVPRNCILTVNGEPQNVGSGDRRLGTPPDDTEEMTHIHLDHPGIQWLFRDMASYAENKHWCSEYDSLASDLGIPGRDRNYIIDVERGGVRFRADVSAPTLELAQAKAEALFLPA